MGRMRLYWVGLALAAAGCAALPQPTPGDVTRAQTAYPGTTLASLSEARTTYVRTCSGCHALHVPTEFPPHQWPGYVNEMVTVQKVKLSLEQRRQIEEFLVVMSETPRTSAQGKPSPL
jgi:hypothetical protein